MKPGHLCLIGIIALAAVVRFTRLEINGPFIDESFYSQALEIGNVNYIVGNAYLWPALSKLGYFISGVYGARVITSIFGLLTIILFYKSTKLIVPLVGIKNSHHVILSTLLFSISLPAIYSSTFATYYSLSLFLFMLGIWLLMTSFVENNRNKFILSAASFTISFATRYGVLGFIPFVIMSTYFLNKKFKSANAKIFWYSFVAFLTMYFIFFGDHVFSAIEHATKTAMDHRNNAGYSITIQRLHAVKILWLDLAPLLLLSILGIKNLLSNCQLIEHTVSVCILIIGAILSLLYHLYSAHTMAFEGNLSLSTIFVSIFAGIGLAEVSIWIQKRSNSFLTITLILIITATTLNHSISRDSELKCWVDWRPVISKVKSMGISKGDKIWSTANNAYPGNVWFLREVFGNRVNEASPWLGEAPSDVLKLAQTNGIPWIVGPLEKKLNIGNSINGYIVRNKIKVLYGPEVFILELSSRTSK